MAKAETKTILKAYSTVESKLPTLPLEDGQLIFVYDKKKIILDNHGVRTVYEQIQTIETEEQRNDLLAPIDSFYFVIETSILWRYSNGHWNQITTSPQEQIDRIVAEGTKQVKAVRDEGQKVLQSIPEDFQTQMETKLNKQQGIENKGKVLVIGEDGNVAPGEVQSGGGDGIAIINTMNGESPLAIPDSAERVNKRLELGGKTEQVSTRGVNLFDVSKVVPNNNVIRNGDGSIKVIANESNNGFAANTPNTLKDYCPLLIVGQTYTLSANTAATTKQIYLKESGAVWTYGESVQITKEMLDSVVLFYSDVNKTSVISNIQIERGSTATAYEPYTGGKPSPSPEYLQEIKNSGKWNEETQKYEVDVKVCNSGYLQKGSYADKIRAFPLEKGKTYRIYVNVNSAVVNTGILDEETTFNHASTLYAYCNKPEYPINNTGIISGKCKIPNNLSRGCTFTVTVDGLFLYQGVNAVSLNTDDAYIAYDFIKTVDMTSPYTEKDPLTITSDRPITKFDKLVEQDGKIGWLYKSKIDTLPKTGYGIRGTDGNKYGVYFGKTGIFKDAITTSGGAEKDSNFFTHFKLGNPYSSNGDIAWLYVNKPGTTDLRVRFADESINTVELFEKYMADKDIKILYETAQTEFVPLQQSEQNAIRALKTYYPTTVITVDGGEVDPDIKVTYTADTKNYIDNKFGKTINAMQTKLLELESRV